MLLNETVIGATGVKRIVAGIGLRPSIQSRKNRAETREHRLRLALPATEADRIEPGELTAERRVVAGIERTAARRSRERRRVKPDRCGKGGR